MITTSKIPRRPINTWLINLLFLCSLPSVTIAQTADAPEYHAGNTWSYRTEDLWTHKLQREGTQTVLGTQGEYVRMEYDFRTADAVTGNIGQVTTNILTQRIDFTSTYLVKGVVGKRVTFAFPLEKGKKWNDVFSSMNRQSDGHLLEIMNSSSALVSAYEDVTVPAGTFKVFKVVHTNNLTDKADATALSTEVTTYWYAPDVKRYVKLEEETTRLDGTPGIHTVTELVSFKLN